MIQTRWIPPQVEAVCLNMGNKHFQSRMPQLEVFLNMILKKITK